MPGRWSNLEVDAKFHPNELWTSSLILATSVSQIRRRTNLGGYAAFLSNDCTSPPTYDRTSILSRDNLRTAFGARLRIGGK